jgi:hypothetical protein
MQVEAIQFTTMLRLLDQRVIMNPDSAKVIQERAFDIIVQVDRFLAGPDLSKHHTLLVKVCQDVLGGLARYGPTILMHTKISWLRSNSILATQEQP